MGETLEIAKGISDYGITIVICAIFLVLSSGLMTACFQWFKKIINDMIEDNKNAMVQQQEKWEKLLEETRKQNEILGDLRESHIQETQTRIRSLSSFAFDLAVEQACHLVRTTKAECDLNNKEVVHEIIVMSVNLAYKTRSARFSPFIYSGKPLSQYFNADWIAKEINAIEAAIYTNEDFISAKTYNKFKLLYEEIKTDFYHNLKID